VKVSGLTILRDAVRLGYPFEASIRSLLPLVDELIVAVAEGEDGTWEAVQAVGDSRLRPFRTRWELGAKGALVLSEQTNLALARCSGDWAMYLQADEVLHEDDLDTVRAAMQRHLHRRTEGLLFDYLHFWGDDRHVVDDWLRFYPRAVRAVKPGSGAESSGDACGFRCRRGEGTRGLLKARSGARIFHYGWCNPPELQMTRIRNLTEDIFGGPRGGHTPASVFTGVVARPFTGAHPRTIGAAAHPGRDTARPRSARLPAWLRCAAGVARSPRARRHEARWLVPAALTNLWWRAVDGASVMGS
jgi:hypothetical protein